ncbi:MAG: MerR family transcriptional regulator [Actinobacteria bacterium]|nr:MerR family transcriptional regulator [Actinomycetota bacterium]
MSRTVTERSHLSIGEVLSLLQDEFPDVTISKIRFLESQGLLDPERTPSGYRKFYDADIDRLRWILRQQREHFLPLKVIKDRLEEVPLDELLAAEEAERDGAGSADPGLSSEGGGDDGSGAAEVREPVASTPAPPGDDAQEAPSEPPAPPPPPPPPPVDAPSKPTAPPSTGGRSEDSVLDPGETSINLSVEELAKATGLTARQVGELERYGLIVAKPLGNTSYYGDDAFIVARTAAAFMSYGIEARHLRMYKVAAEREAGFLEQVIMPILKQRSPDSRQRALAMLDELVGLGDSLRQAMLRHALRDYLERR